MSEAPVLHERDLLVLAKMLAMLGTSNDAERSVVGAKVHAWVTQRGVVWADLLIPPEPPEVEVKVNVGGRPAAAAGNGQAHAAPQRPAQAPPGPQHSNSATGHNWARGPAWGALAEQMLAQHADRLKGDRERTFLADQLSRAMTFGNGVRISDKQEAWLRDILGRASLTW
jgi:hypothetical protein